MISQLQHIFNDCALPVDQYEPVHGGDINQAYCLHTSDAKKYFLKINDANRFVAKFKKESEGLQALHQNSTLIIPAVIKEGMTNGVQYLLLEWLEKGVPKKDCWQRFGAGLATMHQQPQSFFGWQANNFIGSLPQNNLPLPAWHLFYEHCRLMPLAATLFDAGAFYKKDIMAAEMLCKKVEAIFPEEPPALLHGDLWSGNYLITKSGYAATFDPAVYCGHREMDIGMTRLFGGFDAGFYDAYHETYPLQNGWQQRLPLTQLYPLLIHAVLFGGHYVERAKEIIHQFGA